ncbi:MAG: heme ABC exporter ATP-binding protein CcmA [Actinomycetota bacterium]
MISIENVVVTFGRTIALDDLSLELREGVIGLFGPNGSGKSTLLRLIAGLLKPAGGSVTIDGSKLSSGDEALRGQIGYVGHSSGLYSQLTVLENLELFARLYGVDTERCTSLVHDLGLVERSSTRASELSAGYKRRAAVARTLVSDPHVLLLDEPYANLDDEAAELVTNAVRAWKGPGKTCVLATHGAKRVKAYADASIILQQGHAVSYRIRTGAFSSEPAVSPT